ncbi:DUF4176 domain-containing protein [Bombilactobacillus thymidiniphilus]|uniref:DUF4176 domain-containing protein n=1 Tax=Bombilactobacillus thymidiniphilus TaxID=2923363 RepID=UPI00294FEFE9|nr:DUF4176 domain-containing protein [Bombilactobacillus thymidiniphilus]
MGPVIKKDEEQIYFDYSGSIYPEGLDSKKIYYFNQEDITEVVFEGYRDKDSERFNEFYEQWVEDNQDYMSRGEVK